MRRLLYVLLVAGAGVAAPFAGGAQRAQVPYAVLDEDRFLRESQLGRQLLAGIRAAEERLEEENTRISEQLAEEERALTEARAELSPEVFRARADAFDARVEQIRAERRRRSDELARFSEAEAQRFFEAAFPILVELMNDEGIIAILKPEAVIIALEFVDITGRAISRLDSVIAEPSDIPPPSDTPTLDTPLP